MTERSESMAWGGIPFDIRDMRLIRAIEDSGTITAAASLLGYTQPALSQALQRIERRLELQLIQRSGRRIKLTESGRILARYADKAMEILLEARSELSRLQGIEFGEVRVAAFPSASIKVIPRLIKMMKERYPGLTLKYVEATPQAALDMLHGGSIDVALTFFYPHDQDDEIMGGFERMNVLTAGEDPLVAIVPRDFPIARSQPFSISMLKDQKWIAGCPNCRSHLVEMCRTAGFTPDIVFETDSFLAVESIVAQQIGVAVLPSMAVEPTQTHPGIRAFDLPRRDARVMNVVTNKATANIMSDAVVSGLGAVLGTLN